jgi:mycoredoxin
MADGVVVYGSDWCPHTRNALHRLKALGVAYRYVDVDEDVEAERRIAGWNKGRSIRPTITVGDDILVHPGPAVLDAALKNNGYLSNQT